MRTHSIWVVCSNPERFTINTPFARNATGKHLIKSTSLVKRIKALPLFSAMQLTYGYTEPMSMPLVKPIGGTHSGLVSAAMLKFIMQCKL